MIKVLRIVGAFGIRGAVRFRSFSENVENYSVLYSEDGRSFGFTPVKGSGGVARFDGVTDRTAAEQLKGMSFFVKRSDLPRLHDGEFYAEDLIGNDVFVENSRLVCNIENVYNFGAGDILELSYGGALFMVPFTKLNFPDSDKLVITKEAFDNFRQQ